MPPIETAPARWTLIRGARQLLTLQGGSGPRRGRMMNQLEVISNGAVLIKNGVIQCVGPAPRVENLAEAKKASVIDACGRVVMPSFVEADAAFFFDGADDGRACTPQMLRTCSRKKLAWNGIAKASEYARNGTLTAGLPTLCADDLKTLLKLLVTHQALQAKPLRLRPVVSANGAGQHAQKWMRAIKEKKLSSIVEVEISAGEDRTGDESPRAIALAASDAGFALRVRSSECATENTLELAQQAGAIAVLTRPCATLMERFARYGFNSIVTLAPNSSSIAPEKREAAALRAMIEADVPIALSMGPPDGASFTRNMQHLLYMATRQLKMTAEEAITAVTLNAAYSLRAAHLTGSLEPGKSADMLIMDAADYRELVRRPGISNVEVAIRSGQPIYHRAPLILD